MRRKCITTEDLLPDPGSQIKRPCSDCPWTRNALEGWLGPYNADEWIQIAHSDTWVPCHAYEGEHQCAGLAIYRRNVYKRVDPPLLQLERDKENVFTTPMEFKAHHSKTPEKS